jgi:putative transposase
MHRVRLYPTAAQEDRLRFMLDVTRQTYNALLDERRYAWTARRIVVTTKQQYAEITALRAEDKRLAAVYRECIDAVLHRLDLAYGAFFRRYKRGETPGFPRFKPKSRWKQLEFPHGNRALKFPSEKQDRVRVPGVGAVRLRKGRPVPPSGRAFITVKNDRWYAIFESSREPVALQKTGKVIGVDRGVYVLAATSEGVMIRNTREQERRGRIRTRHQRELEAVTKRDERGRCINRDDPKRVASVKRLARAREREANARLDALHKAALKIVRSADVIGLEKLELRAMTRSAKGTVEAPGRNVAAKRGLNRVILDAGFGILARLIGGKAEYAVREVIEVDPKFSSQTCGRCRHVSAKSRRRRRFSCVSCGFSTHADANAALEIRRRAQSARMSEPSRAKTSLAPHDAVRGRT